MKELIQEHYLKEDYYSFFNGTIYLGIIEFEQYLHMPAKDILQHLFKYDILYTESCDLVYFKSYDEIVEVAEWMESIIISNKLAKRG